jgi:hypothetical protein
VGLLQYVAAYSLSDALLFLHEQELSAVSGPIDSELCNSEGNTAWDDFIYTLTTPSWKLYRQWRCPDDVTYLCLFSFIRAFGTAV